VSFIEPIYTVSIKNVHLKAQRIKERYPEWRTGTTDNDLLFARHKELEQELDIKIYFCHKHAPWKKGQLRTLTEKLEKIFLKAVMSQNAPLHSLKALKRN